MEHKKQTKSNDKSTLLMQSRFTDELLEQLPSVPLDSPQSLIEQMTVMQKRMAVLEQRLDNHLMMNGDSNCIEQVCNVS